MHPQVSMTKQWIQGYNLIFDRRLAVQWGDDDVHPPKIWKTWWILEVRLKTSGFLWLK